MARRLLTRLGFNTRHVVPTSWDYKFGSVKEAVWVLVTLSDGSQVAGFWGKRSFASSEIDERDLYIEEVWLIREDGAWIKKERSDGILIRQEQVKHVEFFLYEVNQ